MPPAGESTPSAASLSAGGGGASKKRAGSKRKRPQQQSSPAFGGDEGAVAQTQLQNRQLQLLAAALGNTRVPVAGDALVGLEPSPREGLMLQAVEHKRIMANKRMSTHKRPFQPRPVYASAAGVNEELGFEQSRESHRQYDLYGHRLAALQQQQLLQQQQQHQMHAPAAVAGYPSPNSQLHQGYPQHLPQQPHFPHHAQVQQMQQEVGAGDIGVDGDVFDLPHGHQPHPHQYLNPQELPTAANPDPYLQGPKLMPPTATNEEQQQALEDQLLQNQLLRQQLQREQARFAETRTLLDAALRQQQHTDDNDNLNDLFNGNRPEDVGDRTLPAPAMQQQQQLPESVVPGVQGDHLQPDDDDGLSDTADANHTATAGEGTVGSPPSSEDGLLSGSEEGAPRPGEKQLQLEQQLQQRQLQEQIAAYHQANSQQYQQQHSSSDAGALVGGDRALVPDLYPHKSLEELKKMESELRRRLDNSSKEFKVLWRIRNFETHEGKIYSPEYYFANHRWRLFAYPNGLDHTCREYLSVFVEVLDLPKHDPSLCVIAKFTFSLVHPESLMEDKHDEHMRNHAPGCCPTETSAHNFSQSEPDRGWKKLAPLKALPQYVDGKGALTIALVLSNVTEFRQRSHTYNSKPSPAASYLALPPHPHHHHHPQHPHSLQAAAAHTPHAYPSPPHNLADTPSLLQPTVAGQATLQPGGQLPPPTPSQQQLQLQPLPPGDGGGDDPQAAGALQVHPSRQLQQQQQQQQYMHPQQSPHPLHYHHPSGDLRDPARFPLAEPVPTSVHEHFHYTRVDIFNELDMASSAEGIGAEFYPLVGKMRSTQVPAWKPIRNWISMRIWETSTGIPWQRQQLWFLTVRENFTTRPNDMLRFQEMDHTLQEAAEYRYLSDPNDPILLYLRDTLYDDLVEPPLQSELRDYYLLRYHRSEQQRVLSMARQQLRNQKKLGLPLALTQRLRDTEHLDADPTTDGGSNASPVDDDGTVAQPQPQAESMDYCDVLEAEEELTDLGLRDERILLVLKFYDPRWQRMCLLGSGVFHVGTTIRGVLNYVRKLLLARPTPALDRELVTELIPEVAAATRRAWEVGERLRRAEALGNSSGDQEASGKDSPTNGSSGPGQAAKSSEPRFPEPSAGGYLSSTHWIDYLPLRVYEEEDMREGMLNLLRPEESLYSRRLASGDILCLEVVWPESALKTIKGRLERTWVLHKAEALEQAGPGAAGTHAAGLGLAGAASGGGSTGGAGVKLLWNPNVAAYLGCSAAGEDWQWNVHAQALWLQTVKQVELKEQRANEAQAELFALLSEEDKKRKRKERKKKQQHKRKAQEQVQAELERERRRELERREQERRELERQERLRKERAERGRQQQLEHERKERERLEKEARRERELQAKREREERERQERQLKEQKQREKEKAARERERQLKEQQEKLERQEKLRLQQEREKGWKKELEKEVKPKEQKKEGDKKVEAAAAQQAHPRQQPLEKKHSRAQVSSGGSVVQQQQQMAGKQAGKPRSSQPWQSSTDQSQPTNPPSAAKTQQPVGVTGSASGTSPGVVPGPPQPQQTVQQIQQQPPQQPQQTPRAAQTKPPHSHSLGDALLIHPQQVSGSPRADNLGLTRIPVHSPAHHQLPRAVVDDLAGFGPLLDRFVADSSPHHSHHGHAHHPAEDDEDDDPSAHHHLLGPSLVDSILGDIPRRVDDGSSSGGGGPNSLTRVGSSSSGTSGSPPGGSGFGSAGIGGYNPLIGGPGPSGGFPFLSSFDSAGGSGSSVGVGGAAGGFGGGPPQLQLEDDGHLDSRGGLPPRHPIPGPASIASSGNGGRPMRQQNPSSGAPLLPRSGSGAGGLQLVEDAASTASGGGLLPSREPSPQHRPADPLLGLGAGMEVGLGMGMEADHLPAGLLSLLDEPDAGMGLRYGVSLSAASLASSRFMGQPQLPLPGGQQASSRGGLPHPQQQHQHQQTHHQQQQVPGRHRSVPSGGGHPANPLISPGGMGGPNRQPSLLQPQPVVAPGISSGHWGQQHRGGVVGGSGGGHNPQLHPGHQPLHHHPHHHTFMGGDPPLLDHHLAGSGGMDGGWGGHQMPLLRHPGQPPIHTSPQHHLVHPHPAMHGSGGHPPQPPLLHHPHHGGLPHPHHQPQHPRPPLPPLQMRGPPLLPPHHVAQPLLPQPPSQQSPSPFHHPHGHPGGPFGVGGFGGVGGGQPAFLQLQGSSGGGKRPLPLPQEPNGPHGVGLGDAGNYPYLHPRGGRP